MSTAVVTGKRRRRRLSPSEKYEIYVSVLTGQATQREAAERYGVDRSTVVTACPPDMITNYNCRTRACLTDLEG